MPIIDSLEKISDTIWELPATYKQGMRVPARIIATEKLAREMMAKDLKLKVRLAVEVNQLLEERQLSQDKAARLLGIRQPHVSELVRYRLDRELGQPGDHVRISHRLAERLFTYRRWFTFKQLR